MGWDGRCRSLEDGSVMGGVEIRDCGYKVGLNGVDNGALRFNHVRVPRDNLLNRFGDVARDGTYSRCTHCHGSLVVIWKEPVLLIPILGMHYVPDSTEPGWSLFRFMRLAVTFPV